MGLSQTKLGELVGRSPSSIRAWERDDSTPNDPDVLMALSAVLGVEQRTLFEKAGVDRPEIETSPTLEQELASLRSPLVETEEKTGDQGVQITFSYEELVGLGVELEDEEIVIEEEPGPELEVEEGGESAAPAFAEPRAPYVVTRLSSAPMEQVYAEPSYLEDPSERQLYRVRSVATAVGVVVLLLLLIYAAGKGIESFSEWWDSFFGNLRF